MPLTVLGASDSAAVIFGAGFGDAAAVVHIGRSACRIVAVIFDDAAGQGARIVADDGDVIR